MLRDRIFALAVCALGVLGTAAFDPGFAAGKCEDATVQEAYPANRPPPPKEKQTADSPVSPIKLFQTVEIKVSALPQLTEAECRTKKLIVYLNGIPFSKLAPYVYDSGQNLVRFEFKPYPVPDSTWATILGRPDFDSRPVQISLGLEGEAPFKYGIAKQPQLQILDIPWLLIWAVVFLLLLAAFLLCAARTNIIRDGSPLEFASGKAPLGTFSLAKWQGAWWFFVILSTYLFIGLVTGQFSSSINSTALILLGIGAGTVLGSAIIDVRKDTADDRVQAKAAAVTLKERIEELTAPGKALTAAESTELDQKKSELEKLARRSENFFVDILSDANGVNFHRFQMFAWTIVLSIVFVKAVYEGLAMPTFDTTLMGLLGLSAGTYLGLKIPEPTVPK
jgi:hypothetical protein